MNDILIAEEEEALVPILEGLSREYGLRLVVCADGHSALRVFDQCEPVLCFIDVFLPGVDGFEVCQTIKRRQGARAVSVVMMSTLYTERSDVAEEMVLAGADEFLAKSPHPREVERSLRGLLAERGLKPSPLSGSSGVPELRRSQGSRALRRRPKVLIVEDQYELNFIYRSFISSLNMDGIGAFDGESAVRLFERERPDLCLIDLMLPGIDGLEVARRFRASPKGGDTPIILMSGVYHGSDVLFEKLERHRLDDFINKPFTVKTLQEVLLRHLSSHKPHSQSSKHSGAGSAGAALDGSPDERLSKELMQEGAINQVGFVRLLLEFLHERSTGRLVIRRDELMREVHFEEGSPVHAFSNSMDDALGTLLAKRGRVKMTTINELLVKQEGRTRLGELLVAEALISETELAEALRDQVRQRVLACFGFTEGVYRFEEGLEFIKRKDQTPLHTMALIREGLMRWTSSNEVARLMESHVQRYVVPTQHYRPFFSEFPNSEPERRLMVAINGRVTLTDLLQFGELDITSALSLMWCLQQARMVVFSDIPVETLDGLRPRVHAGEHAGTRPSSDSADSVWSRFFGD